MSPRAEDRGRHQRWDATIGIAAALISVAAPLCIGGVYPAMQLALSLALMLLTIAYALTRGQRGLRLVPFVGLFAAFVALDVVQLLPLPAGLLRLVSPAAWEIRSAVDG